MSSTTRETQTFPCPDCGYEVDPSTGLQCARCGTTLNCSSLSCSECDACSGIFEELRRVSRQRLGRD